MYDIDWAIADYLASVNGRPPIAWSDSRKTWERDILHVTDLNACPRQVALRLRGEDEEPRPPQEARKFVLANFQHELLYRALDYKGVLVDKEVPVPLPDGWSGTADMVLSEFHDSADGMHVADSKNPVAGASKYYADYPKIEEVRQVSVYSVFLADIYKELLEQPEGEVHYLPLGGASQGHSVRFRLLDSAEVLYEMEALEDSVRNEVAAPLPLKIFWEKRRVYERKSGEKTVSGSLAYGTDWRCRYCRFACPNRQAAGAPTPLCKVGVKGVTELTHMGSKLGDDIQRFLLMDAGGGDDEALET